MTALLAIFIVTIAVLGGFRLVLPRHLRDMIGTSELAAALALPLLATFSRFYPVFAIGVAAVILGFPALLGGARGRVATLEQRLRLGCFALPLLPILDWNVSISSFTIVQANYVIIVTTVLAVAVLMAGVRPPRSRLATWDATFAAMLFAQLFMDVRGDDLLFTLRTVLQLTLTLALPYFAFSRAVAKARDPGRLLLALLLAAAVIAGIAMFEAVRSWLLYEGMTATVGADPEARSGYGKLRGGLLRPRATWPESTGLSLFFAVMLTTVYAMRRQIGSLRPAVALALILAGGLFLTFARVGYIAVAVGLAAAFLHERRYGRLALLVIAVPLAALGLLALGKAVPMIGISIGLADDAASTLDYRGLLLRDGLALWRENWLIGVSLSEVFAALDHLRQGEGIIDLVNQPLAILMRGGIVFALLYYALTMRVLAALFARRPRLAPEARAIAGAVFAGLLTLLAGLLTTSYGRNETTFVMLLGIGAGVLARRPVAAAPSGAVEDVVSSPKGR